MTALAAVAVLVLLTMLTVVQALGAAGRSVGCLLWGGRHTVLPPRLRRGSVFAIVLYVAFGVVLASRGGLLPGGGTGFIHIASWVLAAYFLLGTGMNALSQSRQERTVMTPVSALLAGLAMLLAITGG